MKKRKDIQENYEVRDYVKSNFLISAKYKSTLFENQIMAISLSKILNAEEDELTGVIESQIRASEIKELLNKKSSGSFYDQLKRAAHNMTGKSIGIEDNERETFDYIAVIIRATYENGVFTIKYNPDIKSYLKNLRKNFTPFNLRIMIKFTNVYAFRLYELLKSKAYMPKVGLVKGKTFKEEYTLSELKLVMGVVNPENEKVKRFLNNCKTPDFDKAVEIAPEQMYSTWMDFKKYVLEPAVSEINEMSDIRVEYKNIKGGKGGRTYMLHFYVTYIGEDIREKRNLTDEEKDNVLDEIMELIKEPLKLKDVKAIATAAEYDIEKIKAAYEISQKQTKDIRNLTGYLITAIEDDYQHIYVEAMENPKRNNSKKMNQFNQMTIVDYNFEELERLLPDN